MIDEIKKTSSVASNSFKLTENHDARLHAEWYRDRGWVPIPTMPRGKQPTRNEWQKSTLESPLDDFAADSNVAILLGAASDGLVDIDLDCKEAVVAAEYLLPPTDLIFGPANNPRNHYLYRTPNPSARRQYVFRGECLLEYRGTGSATVFPPSPYLSGEPRDFLKRGEPGQLSEEMLQIAVSRTAAAALLAKHWIEGGRHSLTLALTGALARAGWKQEEAGEFITAICVAAKDDQLNGRLADVQTSFARFKMGLSVTGVPSIEHQMGAEITKKLYEWLCLKSSSAVIGHNGPAVEECVRFTDIGNTDKFVEEYGDQLIYCTELGWLIWNGTAWAPDGLGKVVQYAERTIRRILGDARQIGRSHLGSKSSVTSILDLAKSRLSESIDRFDVNDWLLNCPDGTIDLRSGVLSPHSRDDLITKVTAASFDRDAPCPRFDNFMHEIMMGDKENVEFLRRALGYSLTGSTSEQCLFVLHGSGANGKSTLINFFEYLLGDYASNTPAQTFLVKKHDGGVPNDIARLRGTRFVTASETEEAGQRLAVSLLKRLTGGDTITARFLHKEYFSFIPKLKPWMPTNFKPNFNGTDKAMKRRIHLIPFDYVVPEARRDGHLLEHLKAEANGILAWAVKGCLDWQQSGLNPPESIRRATQSYLDEMDVIGQFLADTTQRSRTARLTKGEAYDAFLRWAQASGNDELSKALFGQGMKASGLEEGKNGSKGRYWKGIELISEKLSRPEQSDVHQLEGAELEW